MPISSHHVTPLAPAREPRGWIEGANNGPLTEGSFTAAPVALLQLDHAFNPVAANDAYRLMLEARGPRELPDYRMFLNEVERRRHDHFRARMADSQLGSFRIEVVLALSGGRLVSTLVSGAPLAHDGRSPTGFVISLTDVTAIRRHVEVAALQHDALNQALEEMLAGLVIFDADDRLVFCNRRYREFYYVPDELARPGTPFSEMLLEEIRSGQLAMTAEEQELFVKARLQRRHAAGLSKGAAVESTIVEQRNANGRWLQIRERVMADGWVVGVHVDATTLKDKEQALETHIQELHAARTELERRTMELADLAATLTRARDEALGAARAKANFLANMSHELRTPLNAVIGFAEILAAGSAGPLTAKQTEYLTDICNSGKHLLDVINDILDISKADAGKIELQEDAIELANFVGGTIRLMSETAREKNLNLACDIPAALTRLVVVVDVRRFRQILLNLLANAIKFTPEQGSVKLSIAVPDEGGVNIIVSDTGIGISAEDQKKVFVPFEQADGSLARRYEGTGLGLALVKALTELHQGRVTLTSQLGAGTQVTIWLPPSRVPDVG